MFLSLENYYFFHFFVFRVSNFEILTDKQGFRSSTNQVMSKAIIVIGIHHKELLFGMRVSEVVKETGIDVLKIEQGLSSKKP